MGFFAKAGIDADIQLMQGSSVIASAVLSNAVDIGYSAVDTLATAHQKAFRSSSSRPVPSIRPRPPDTSRARPAGELTDP